MFISLSSDSKEVIRKLMKGVLTIFCEILKKLFQKKEKGDWFNKNTSEYNINLGKLKTRITQEELTQIFYVS